MNRKGFKDLFFNDNNYSSKLNITCQCFIECLENIRTETQHKCIFDTLIITKEDSLNNYDIFDETHEKIFSCQNTIEFYNYFNLGRNFLKLCPNSNFKPKMCLYFDKLITNFSKPIDDLGFVKDKYSIRDYKEFENLASLDKQSITEDDSNLLFYIFIFLIILSFSGVIAVVYMAFFYTKKSNDVDKEKDEEIEILSK